MHVGLLLEGHRHFHPPKHNAEQNELWLVAIHVSQTASGWSLANESGYGDLLPSVWMSGYAKLSPHWLFKLSILSVCHITDNKPNFSLVIL